MSSDTMKEQADVFEKLQKDSSLPDLEDIVNLNKPTNTFIVVIIFCFIIFLFAVLLFSWLRTKVKTIYTPRLLLLRENVSPLGKLPSSFFAWISPAFMVNDDDIFSHIGLDALIFLRFLKLIIKATFLALPFGIIVLIPLNVNGGMKLKEGLDQISMSNMKQGSPKLWAHFIAVWMYSFAILYFINEEWKVYVLYRQAYLAKGSGKQYTLLVRDIPRENVDQEKLTDYVEKLFPNKVFKILVVQDLKSWQSLIKKHDQLVKKLERIKAKYEGSSNKFSNLIEPRAEVIVLQEQELQILQEKMGTEQSKSYKNLPCAFVFFNSLSTRSTASQIVWDMLIGNYRVQDAPDPGEIEWKNLALSPRKRALRRVVSSILVVSLIILWAIPITFVAFLTKIKSMAELKEFSFIRSSVKSSSAVGQGLIQGLIPVLLTTLTYMAMPMILGAVGKFKGLISKSQIESFVFCSLSVFLVINTFFVFITAGSFFSKSEQIIKAPYNITKELAIALPSQANFYLNYVCILGFGGTGLQLTRLVALVYARLYSLYARTPRERLDAWKPGPPPYAKLLANDILIFIIGISYSVLSPVIMPAVFFYFGFSYVVWAYQLLHVYIPDHDLGGKLWPHIASSMIVGVLIFQLLMIGVFSLKQAFAISICLAPLPIITLICWRYMATRYDKVGTHLSLREGRCTRDADRQFLQNLVNSYKLNYSYPGLYEVSSKPELDVFDNDEYVPIDAEQGRELHGSNYNSFSKD